jgi:hypothetical protein
MVPVTAMTRVGTCKLRNSLYKHSNTNTDATWTDVTSGCPVSIKLYVLPKRFSIGRVRSHLIVAKCRSMAPGIIHYYSRNGNAHCGLIRGFYKMWIGIDGDEAGFEATPSIIKMTSYIGSQLAGTNVSSEAAFVLHAESERVHVPVPPQEQSQRYSRILPTS